jgi:hypothetical protein
MIINNNEFLVKQSDVLPDDYYKGTAQQREIYINYWKEEKRRCIEGYTVGGKFMSGDLYYYVNYWTILMDAVSSKSKSKRMGHPLLRDIEWEFFRNVEIARKANKGIILVSGREIGKSYWASSITGHSYTFYPNSVNVVSSSSSDDNDPLMKKIDFGLNSLPFAFRLNRLVNQLNNEILSGHKTIKEGIRTGFLSNILVRNFADGSNSMVCNGLRPRIQVFEEIGKSQKLIECYNNSAEAWMEGTYQICFPLLIGTGGDMDKGEDASKMFYNPKAYNLLSFEDEKGGEVGYFLPGYMNFNEYRDNEGIIDNQKAKQYIIDTREEKRKAKDRSTYLKYVMYHPLTPDECFLRTGNNIFNLDKLNEDLSIMCTVKKYKEILQSCNLEWVDTNKTKVKMEICDNINQGQYLIYIHPKPNEPFGLYIAGTDPFDHSNIENGSLGSTFIYKRMSDITSIANLPVAEYTCRPVMADEYYDNVLKLLVYYNARDLVERNNPGCINYFKRLSKLHFLIKEPALIKEVSPNSNLSHKGLHGIMMTDRVKRFLEEKIRDYIEENCGINIVVDDDGKEEKQPGKIVFPKLLEELIRYDPLRGNYDRVISFGLCLIHEAELFNFKIEAEVKQDYFRLGKYRKDFNGNIRYI